MIWREQHNIQNAYPQDSETITATFFQMTLGLWQLGSISRRRKQHTNSREPLMELVCV